MGKDRTDLQGLGVYIRTRRQELGLTQTQLGRRIGYYQERISALERGTYGLPSLPAMEELAGGLECGLMELLGACGYVEARTVSMAGEDVVTAERLRECLHEVFQELVDVRQRLKATEEAMAALRQQVGEETRLAVSR